MPAETTSAGKVVQPADMKWEQHPKFKGVESAYLLSKRDDNSNLTYAITIWHVGARFEKHIHEHADDLIYIIQGKARVWIDGIGDVPMVAGSFVKIPKGTSHQPHDVEEEVIAQHTWNPATV